MRIVKQNSKVLILLIALVFILSGCDSNNNTMKKNDVTYDTEGLNHITCTRDAYTDDSSTDVEIDK